jgi:iron(III)-enterobactin esterase
MSNNRRATTPNTLPAPEVVATPAALAAAAIPGGPVVLPDVEGHVRVVFRFHPGPGTRRRPRRVWLDVTGVTHRGDVDAAWMQPTADGLGWHLTLRLPDALRAAYSFVPVEHDDPVDLADVPAARAFLAAGLADPHVEETLPGNGWRGVRSVLTLPAAPPAQWVPTRSGQAHRTAVATLDDPVRTLRWHETPVPPGVDRRDRALVLLTDGEVWLGPLSVAASLDRLVRRGELPALVVAGVDNPHESRERDLTTPGRLSAAWRQDLLPALHERVAVTRDPARVVVAGQSYGGLAAFRMLCEAPDLTGRGVCQSPSFWFPGSQDMVEQLDPAARLVLQHGTREGDLTQAAREVAGRLRGRPQLVRHQEVEGGHDHAWWRHALVAGLRDVLS